MTIIWLLFASFLPTFVKRLRPGGSKALLAEILLLKQQLLMLTRTRDRAPNLSSMHRVLRKHGTPESRGDVPFLAQVPWTEEGQLVECGSVPM